MKEDARERRGIPKIRDPLRDFDWPLLYECYDARCRRFDPASVHLRAITPRPQSDRELYYCLIDRAHPTSDDQPRLSIDLYEALLYWKLYSYPLALRNVRRWLHPHVRAARSANLERLFDELPRQLDRDTETVIDLVKQLDRHEVIGMKNETALPMRTTFLHYLFPEVVPVVDKMVLQAVGVQEQCANTRITVFQAYLRFAWKLTDRYAASFPTGYRESSVRLIDMALWVVRGKGCAGKPRV